jgi:hypothetical protein
MINGMKKRIINSRHTLISHAIKLPRQCGAKGQDCLNVLYFAYCLTFRNCLKHVFTAFSERRKNTICFEMKNGRYLAFIMHKTCNLR